MTTVVVVVVLAIAGRLLWMASPLSAGTILGMRRDDRMDLAALAHDVLEEFAPRASEDR